LAAVASQQVDVPVCPCVALSTSGGGSIFIQSAPDCGPAEKTAAAHNSNTQFLKFLFAFILHPFQKIGYGFLRRLSAHISNLLIKPPQNTSLCPRLTAIIAAPNVDVINYGFMRQIARKKITPMQNNN
jgi:hypothetical protein